jgi:hypothetical protein
MAWVATVHGLFAYFAWERPDLLESGAYAFATGLMPLQVWAVTSAAVTLTLAHSWFKHSLVVAFVGLGLALPTQVIFGLSILLLTLEGSASAIIGSVQWWTMAVANGLVLGIASTRGITPAQESP